jgi:hypothetical protein
MLGAVQQRTLPRLGFVPEAVPAAQAAVVYRLSDLQGHPIMSSHEIPF